jgi:hypothetical protein
MTTDPEPYSSESAGRTDPTICSTCGQKKKICQECGQEIREPFELSKPLAVIYMILFWSGAFIYVIVEIPMQTTMMIVLGLLFFSAFVGISIGIFYYKKTDQEGEGEVTPSREVRR